MPERFTGPVAVGDLTGHIARELHRKRQVEVRKQTAQRQREIAREAAEIEAAKGKIPVAYETWSPEDVIDYTQEGGYRGRPSNEYDAAAVK